MALDRKALVIAGTVLLLGGSLCLFPFVGTEFLTPSDEGEVRVSGEMEVSTRLEVLDELTDTTLNFQSTIGCIMLGGIVVNNAILLVDQAGQLRGEGRSVRDALVEAGRRRLRPILMTTSTTILGLLPLGLGLGLGEGADAQAPLARAVVGGLVASTGITLLLIPVIDSLVHQKSVETRQADARILWGLQASPTGTLVRRPCSRHPRYLRDRS